VVGLAGAAVSFVGGQLALAVVRPLWVRLLVALAFVAPALITGYHANHGIVKHTMPSETWQLVFSVIGAVAVGITAFVRVTTTALAASEPSRRGTVRA
jgi:disulfide bond formation protein DsbB